jgi:hypothetical protein
MTDEMLVRERIRAIAVALELPDPDHEVETARASDEATVEWAVQHNQSLDWIWLGNPVPMFRMMARQRRADQ